MIQFDSFSDLQKISWVEFLQFLSLPFTADDKKDGELVNSTAEGIIEICSKCLIHICVFPRDICSDERKKVFKFCLTREKVTIFS